VDRALTGLAGLVAVAELVDRLGAVEALDERVGPVKQRARGLSSGGLLVGLASAQLAGQATLAGLDRLRLDEAPQGYEMFLQKQDDCVKVVLRP